MEYVPKYVRKRRYRWWKKELPRQISRRYRKLSQQKVGRKEEFQVIDGNRAAAIGVTMCRVGVVAAYPITPQSPVTEALSEFVERGELNAQYVAVESEHSALAVCTSASIAGARAFTATASHGLAYMHEMLHWAAGTRLPLVLCCVNRALGAPWSVQNDQQDSISQRDTGWIQIYARNNQEIIDTVIQAFRIAEMVYVPVMVCYDGYILSHTEMPVSIPVQEDVDKFLPPFKTHTVLDSKDPRNYNLVTLSDPRVNAEGKLCHGYMELRYLLQEALQESRQAIVQVGEEFGEIFGRSYATPLWEDHISDAEIVMVAMGSLAMEAIVAADLLRAEGHKVGVLGIRVFRPFPKSDIVRALSKARFIVVFDKNISYGSEGATCSEIKAALYGNNCDAIIRNYIVGLGGRAVSANDMADVVKKAMSSMGQGQLNNEDPEWICHI